MHVEPAVLFSSSITSVCVLSTISIVQVFFMHDQVCLDVVS